MKNFFTCLLLSFLLIDFSAEAQAVRDKVVELSQTIQTDPPGVVLSWNNPTGSSDITLFRRDKDAAIWFLLLQESASAATTFTDTQVELGKTYEYGIVRVTGGIQAFGYLTTPVQAPVIENRGKMLVFVESALEAPLEMELERLRHDLVGDGWQVLWYAVESDASVTSVKSQIEAAYHDDSLAVKSVLLFGQIPVPYSGNAAWDGHTDHQGAWPADTYYGDMDSDAWTDVTVNNTSAARPENDNVPGDGKFDQSFTPTALELVVGRVDFSNIDEGTFGATRTELYRRYLDKNHRWRNKLYTVENQAIVDDNFGYFSGEAFAADAYRNGYPLVGMGNVVTGDFFNDTDDDSYLFGYGCGGGTYTGAGGVGNSAQFGSDSVNIVFSMLFGSYHGDWDYSPNPFMPSALASKGGILTCGWAGRPDWFAHHLGAGETIGYSALLTQNSCDIDGYYPNFGECGAHIALMGDPSLRAQIVAPATDLVLQQQCNEVMLSWTGSSQPNLMGYHVYRSQIFNGVYTRLTNAPISDNSFTDNNPVAGALYYQVRAVAMEQTPSGSFYNTSTGVFGNLDFVLADPPVADAGPDQVLTCA